MDLETCMVNPLVHSMVNGSWAGPTWFWLGENQGGGRGGLGGLGKLPTVRQSYLQSGKATYSQAKLPTVRHAPNNRIHAPNRAIDMHPKGIDMHPKLSIDLHPTSAYFAPNRFRIHAPKFRIPAPEICYVCSKFESL